jgi:hypothetical protein
MTPQSDVRIDVRTHNNGSKDNHIQESESMTSNNGTSNHSCSSNNSSHHHTFTKLVQPEPTFYHCTSTEPIVQRAAATTASTTVDTVIQKTAKEINETELNLYLGHPWLQRERNLFMVRFLRFLFTVLSVDVWEHYVYQVYNSISTSARRYITYKLWNVYCRIHAYCLNTKTGIHSNASIEYHALTTIMYFFRFLPITVPRMRFSLHQLTSCQPVFILSRTRYKSLI